jgi:uroporphyrinogen decarboxylase
MMNSLERCMMVLNGGMPDRVPVCLENFQHAAAFAGYTVREYCYDARKMADAHLKTWDYFRHDMIDLENGVAALAHAVGCSMDFLDENAPPWVMGALLPSIREVGALKPLDPYADGTLPALIDATRLISQEVGGRVCLLSEADQGPFSLAAQIVGAEEFLTALLDAEQEVYVHQLLHYCTDTIACYARALHDAGAHLTMIGDSIAGPDVCSPRIYRTFAFPYEKQLVDTLRAEGIFLGLHICGNATAIIDAMVATGALFLQVDYKINRARCKQAAQGKTTLIGTVDPSGVMALGTPEDVTHAARVDLDALAEQGGFILSPGCTLPYTTPNENVTALCRAAVEFGAY